VSNFKKKKGGQNMDVKRKVFIKKIVENEVLTS
jgi:hypothetical protein